MTVSIVREHCVERGRDLGLRERKHAIDEQGEPRLISNHEGPSDDTAGIGTETERLPRNDELLALQCGVTLPPAPTRGWTIRQDRHFEGALARTKGHTGSLGV